MSELSTSSSLPSTYTIDREYYFLESPNDTALELSNEFPIPDFLLLLGVFLLLIIFLSGLVGNGIVIWFLSFIVQKNAITTYVLNLAAADSCVLISLALWIVLLNLKDVIGFSPIWSSVIATFFLFSYSTSLHLLTAISTERCLCVLFPIWYRCHRPKHLSAIVCALIWGISCLLHGSHILILSTIYMKHGISKEDIAIPMLVNIISFFLCTPVVLVCTVILFNRVCHSLHRPQRGKFYTVVLLTLLFFLIFGLPLSAMVTIQYFHFNEISDVVHIISFVCAPINSSINPLLYFLIGRKKIRRSRESLKMVLERVFSDKDDHGEGGNLPRIEIN